MLEYLIIYISGRMGIKLFVLGAFSDMHSYILFNFFYFTAPCKLYIIYFYFLLTLPYMFIAFCLTRT